MHHEVVEPALTPTSIQNCATVGHVEEICISKGLQGKGLGLKMLNALDSVAKNLGCSKSILNCDPEKRDFYVKCGYAGSGVEMQHQFVEKSG